MAASSKKTQTATFSKVKETANTIRYEEVVADDALPVVGSLYIKKGAAKELGNPETVTIVITAG